MKDMPRFLGKKINMDDTMELDELPKSIAHAQRQYKRDPIIEASDRPWEKPEKPTNDEIDYSEE